jgi:hypothetical protein
MGCSIILNATYGLSNNEYSYLYDPKLTLAITVNGQLLISMLVERMVLEIKASCIAANTDGATFLIKKDRYEDLQKIVREWQDMTKLNLEEEKYDRMFFRDINNYVWIKEGKEPKLKGVFEINKAWHKDHSQACVAKVLKEYFVNNIPVEESITSITDPYDFYKEIKLNKNMKLVGRKSVGGKVVETEYSKLTR